MWLGTFNYLLVHCKRCQTDSLVLVRRISLGSLRSEQPRQTTFTGRLDWGYWLEIQSYVLNTDKKVYLLTKTVTVSEMASLTSFFLVNSPHTQLTFFYHVSQLWGAVLSQSVYGSSHCLHIVAVHSYQLWRRCGGSRTGFNVLLFSSPCCVALSCSTCFKVKKAAWIHLSQTHKSHCS